MKLKMGGLNPTSPSEKTPLSGGRTSTTGLSSRSGVATPGRASISGLN